MIQASQSGVTHSLLQLLQLDDKLQQEQLLRVQQSAAANTQGDLAQRQLMAERAIRMAQGALMAISFDMYV